MTHVKEQLEVWNPPATRTPRQWQLKNPQLVKAAAAAFDEDICGGNYGGVSDQMTKLNY